MADTYNLNQLWRLFSTSRKERLMVATYGQISNLVIFSDEGQKKEPLIRMFLDGGTVAKLMELLKKLLDSPPNTRLSFLQMKWNRDAKSLVPSASFIFFRDEQNKAGIEVSGELLREPVKFYFELQNVFESEGARVTDTEATNLAIVHFIRILDRYLPVSEMLSTFNFSFKTSENKTNGNSGGGNYSKPAYGGGSSNDTLF